MGATAALAFNVCSPKMAQEERKRRLAPTVFQNVQIISGPTDPSIDIVLVLVLSISV